MMDFDDTRQEVQERVHERGETMERLGENLDRIAQDAQRVRDTKGDLDLHGTADYVEEVTSEMEQADDVTVDAFDSENEQLEGTHDETEAYEGGLQERSDATDQDAESIQDAASEVTTDATRSELEKAREAALHEVDFMAEQIDRSREAREESERLQAELERIVHNKES